MLACVHKIQSFLWKTHSCVSSISAASEECEICPGCTFLDAEVPIAGFPEHCAVARATGLMKVLDASMLMSRRSPYGTCCMIHMQCGLLLEYIAQHVCKLTRCTLIAVSKAFHISILYQATSTEASTEWCTQFILDGNLWGPHISTWSTPPRLIHLHPITKHPDHGSRELKVMVPSLPCQADSMFRCSRNDNCGSC
jgi:hypothetical protein